MEDTRTLATRAEVAKYLGLPVGTLVQWGHKRIGPPYIRVGRHARYRWSDVEAWLDAQDTGGKVSA